MKLLQRQLSREQQMTLTTAKLNDTLAFWWANKKNKDRAATWLAQRFASWRESKRDAHSFKKCKKQTTKKEPIAHLCLPEHGKDALNVAIAKWSEEDETAISSAF